MGEVFNSSPGNRINAPLCSLRKGVGLAGTLLVWVCVVLILREATQEVPVMCRNMIPECC